jgi:tRNA A37 N6-isopentenylltransferase MiaA
VVVCLYRYPQLLKDEIEHQCDDMLQQDIIRECTSAFSSPVLLIRKADATWHSCIDYRELNQQMMKDTFLILVVDELLDELCGVSFFTKVDLRNGYH